MNSEKCIEVCLKCLATLTQNGTHADTKSWNRSDALCAYYSKIHLNTF